MNIIFLSLFCKKWKEKLNYFTLKLYFIFMNIIFASIIFY
jgi:hypothetical protein